MPVKPGDKELSPKITEASVKVVLGMHATEVPEMVVSEVRARTVRHSSLRFFSQRPQLRLSDENECWQDLQEVSAVQRLKGSGLLLLNLCQ